MIRRLVLFLVRKKLGLKKYEHFKFANQQSETTYYAFDDTCIWKIVLADHGIEYFQPSNVSLNYLLSTECEVVKL